ncbi:MAG: DUF4832 domain-containing protein [Kiritimatiellae bacterium]|nr:DUF4832 domain-containing protein [Kiritimatiellia bacterium]
MKSSLTDRWTTSPKPPPPVCRAICRLVLATVAVPLGASAADAVVVRPTEIPDLLPNPHMGWQTFHRTARSDRALPPWIPSTVAYTRWGWGELEPEPGRLNAELLDRQLAECRAAGQTLAFRVMCCSTTPRQPYHPKWLEAAGGRVIAADYNGQEPLPIPDFDDPRTLELHLDFLRRLGERYDGHPDLEHVDLGSIGWWGEWHLSGSRRARLPSLDVRRRVVSAYLAAFRRTPLLMLVGGRECLREALERGTGWRADCLGDMGGFSKNWCHMRRGYPVWLREAGALEAWRRAPVAWETCWDIRRWVHEGWSLRYIFNYALACHGSFVNNKSAPLPESPEVRAEIERFLRRLGYRFVLRELRHPASARPGDLFRIVTVWQNVGSAPCYRPYRLAWRLTATDGRQLVFPGQTTVERWMPGDVPVFDEAFLHSPPDLPPGPPTLATDELRLPPDLPAGQYGVALAIVPPDSLRPAIRIAIKGRADDGWYPLTAFEVRP